MTELTEYSRVIPRPI